MFFFLLGSDSAPNSDRTPLGQTHIIAWHHLCLWVMRQCSSALHM